MVVLVLVVWYVSRMEELHLHALVSLARLYGWPQEKIERLANLDEKLIEEAKALQVPIGAFHY